MLGGLAALSIALSDQRRDSGIELVLVPGGESNANGATSIHATPSTLDPGRMLSVAPEWQPGEAVERIERFISVDGHGGIDTAG